MQDNQPPYAKILAVLLLTLSFIIVSTMGHDDAIKQQNNYCEMVMLWESQREAGVPPLERNGWPAKDAQQRKECMQ